MVQVSQRRFTARRLLSKLFAMLEKERTITKRQLGIALSIGGGVGAIAVLSIDLLEVGREGGIGPVQAAVLIIMVAALAVGLSLIPLGDSPA